MRYISIDLETTGLDPERHDILEFAAVLEDTDDPHIIGEAPYFNVGFRKESWRWDMGTLNFHIDNNYFPYLNQLEKIHHNNLAYKFKRWLSDNGIEDPPIVVTGKNFASFDQQFLLKLREWDEIKIHRRIMDPTMMYMLSTDDIPPNMKTCRDRAGLEVFDITHRAIDDARLIILLLRRGLK